MSWRKGIIENGEVLILAGDASKLEQAYKLGVMNHNEGYINIIVNKISTAIIGGEYGNLACKYESNACSPNAASSNLGINVGSVNPETESCKAINDGKTIGFLCCNTPAK